MNEKDLIEHWTTARRHIIAAQLGPIFLLTSTIALLQFGLADAELVVRLAAAGILLASGLLGAASEIAAAREGRAVAADLAALGATTSLGRSVVAAAPWTVLVSIVAPAIFVAIFVFLLAALFVPGLA
ncbi:hypothetical protein [Marisediminicola senii]|uniref:hypothetical protein n=1 Tax=Marisediminicola senii TaxID=2711233 RepID=UPI0013EC08A2|nr:hypothetical protein [Marisediminicola senii]